MSKLKTLILTPLMLVCTTVLTLHTRSAHAQIPCRYDVQIIQAPVCGIFGHQPTTGMGINSSGDVCGFHCACTCAAKYDRAFLWRAEGGFLTLALPPGIAGANAYDVNDALQVVGTMDNIPALGQHGFVWQHGQWIELSPSGGGFHCGAFAINRAAQVVGYRDLGPTTRYGFIWQSGVFTPILPSYGTESIAMDINDNGAVTGSMAVSFGIDSHPFLWMNGAIRDLGVLPGGSSADAFAINIHNQIVGSGHLPAIDGSGSTTRAFLWTDGVMSDLGTLPGFFRSFAFDINDAGQIVGLVQGRDREPIWRGFVWQNGVMTDLNDLVSPELGVVITQARAINGNGQIVCWADGTIGVVALLLTPVASTSADLTDDCHVDVHDLTILLNDWGTAGSPADLNKDGTVNTLDLGILLVNWG